MSEFKLYFNIGIDHILGFQAYDHLLFVIALCVIYQHREWRKLLFLVTAFTLGHSLTLVLSTFNVLGFRAEYIEFLIPITIFVTAAINIYRNKPTIRLGLVGINYMMALGFGLIHGMGFSHYLKSLLGQEQSIFIPLLAFNLGIEIAQLVIVAFFMLLSYIFIYHIDVNRRDWNMVISSAIAGIALILMAQTKFW
jgi:hypothetical protein